ncbi:MAG TPA: DUF6502 family protein [Desulfosarcina sp.]|nr:DUF6502 family protein [Desulfosarcina sp.]
MDNNQDTIQVLYAAILRLLRPLVRMALKRGVSYGTFTSLLKWVFYEVAKADFTIEGKKQTQSRISVITGFTRKEVKRLAELDAPTSRNQREQYNRAARVISGWRRDADYLDGQGRPEAIPISGDGATFETLVRRFSGDMPPRAVLDELTRLGALRLEPGNRVRLIQESFTPTADDAIKFHILGTDVDLLISTIEHNIELHAHPPYYQRKVYYDNLPDEALDDFRTISRRQAQKLLDALDNHLASADRDVNPEVKGTGRNVAGMGIYYFQRPFDEED